MTALMKVKKKIYCALGLIVFVGLVCILLQVVFTHGHDRTFHTKANLASLRGLFRAHKTVYGEHPPTLAKLREDYDRRRGSTIVRKIRSEHISDTDGCSSESAVLNGKGGWYYDRKTGDIRINLTQPVKHYMKWYFGFDRNEKPSDW